MKKKTVSPKKRTVRRRKQQRSKKRQRSLQQRLARLAKAQRPFNSLVAALAKASASAIALVESEKLRQLPRLGKAVLNINLDTQDAPNSFQMQPPAAQRSLQGSLSLPQRLTSTLQVESSALCRATVLLWVVPRHSWPLSLVGCRPSPPECTPCLLTHVGEPTLSAAGSSALLAVALMADSRSIAVEPQAEKCFQEELPLPGLVPAVPAACLSGFHRAAPVAATPLLKSHLVAKGVFEEQPPVKEHLLKACKSRRASQHLTKTSGFIRRKSYCCYKKPLFQRILRSTKNQRPCLGKARFSIAGAHAWSPAAGAAGSCAKHPVKSLCRKHRGGKYAHFPRRGSFAGLPVESSDPPLLGRDNGGTAAPESSLYVAVGRRFQQIAGMIAADCSLLGHVSDDSRDMSYLRAPYCPTTAGLHPISRTPNCCNVS